MMGQLLPLIITSNVWDLRARPDLVEAAAQAWRAVELAANESADRVDDPAQALYDGPWAGDTADSFDHHRTGLTRDVRDAALQACLAAIGLEAAAGLLRAVQDKLSAELSTIADVPGVSNGDQLTFAPRTIDESTRVGDALARAREIRHDLDYHLSDDIAKLERTRPEWQTLGKAWTGVASGATPAFTMPPEANVPMVIMNGNQAVVYAGNGADRVDVSTDPVTGETIIKINNQEGYRFPASDQIVIRAGAGDDEVTIWKGMNAGITVLGGEGSDIIRSGEGDDTILGLGGHDFIYAGGGRDRVSGGADRDYIEGQGGDDRLSGGLGDDTLYGLDGNDRLAGGLGQDYLEGGTGNDTLDGEAGDDILSGGRNDDTIRGGAGNDVVYAGKGHDTTDAGAGVDKVYAEKGDTTTGSEQTVVVKIKDVPKCIVITGDQAFQDRVQADLEMLASSPTGAQMLDSFSAVNSAGDTRHLWWGHDGPVVKIEQWNADPHGDVNSSADVSGQRDELITYAEELDFLAIRNHPTVTPPVAVLYHEMAHVWDFQHHTMTENVYWTPGPDAGIPNNERVATGLPIDEDRDPATPEELASYHPAQLTENALRDEMGAPHRDVY